VGSPGHELISVALKVVGELDDVEVRIDQHRDVANFERKRGLHTQQHLPLLVEPTVGTKVAERYSYLIGYAVHILPE